MTDVHASKLRMIGFSLPALSINMLITAVFVILPPLYAEHRGLGAATVGLIFLAAKFVDMIAAPAWGLFMDSYKTRWGRRRPYRSGRTSPHGIWTRTCCGGGWPQMALYFPRVETV